MLATIQAPSIINLDWQSSPKIGDARMSDVHWFPFLLSTEVVVALSG